MMEWEFWGGYQWISLGLSLVFHIALACSILHWQHGTKRFHLPPLPSFLLGTPCLGNLIILSSVWNILSFPQRKKVKFPNWHCSGVLRRIINYWYSRSLVRTSQKHPSCIKLLSGPGGQHVVHSCPRDLGWNPGPTDVSGLFAIHFSRARTPPPVLNIGFSPKWEWLCGLVQ